MQNQELLEISICWSTAVDLDLCVFYRCADGREGGVFSDEFRCNPSDLGSLGEFPFMLHLGDMKAPQAGQCGTETVQIASPELFERLDIVVINYADAIDLLDVDYTDREGYCRIGEQTVPSSPEGRGQAYHVATLSVNSDGSMKVETVNRVVTLREAYDSIPGFPLICE